VRRDRLLTTSGAKYLAECLQHNTTLLELDLGDNNINDDGANALCQALKSNNKTLKRINLAGNLVKADAVAAIKQQLSANKGARDFAWLICTPERVCALVM
jgi:Ran GTPase-activating protein (RanGAP) involved in mRNA processing and transport